MYRIFIDGQEGTTGLQLRQRLERRPDVSLIEIDPALRKDASARARCLNEADLAFLCLPDAAAKEAVALVTNPDTVLIDASTAHRTAEGWAYGFPELSAAQAERIAHAKRIANPGCYATCFVSMAAPLVAAGLLPPDYPVVVHGVSGYSGAGKKGIAQYEADERDPALETPRLYALSLAHKHLPEMQKIAGLRHAPIFNPYVCDYYAGMTVCLPLFPSLMAPGCTKAAVEEALRTHYAGQPFVSVDDAPASGFLPANTLVGTNRLSITVCGTDERLTLTASLDNLGKGASGAAVQNMNLALGLQQEAYLI